MLMVAQAPTRDARGSVQVTSHQESNSSLNHNFDEEKQTMTIRWSIALAAAAMVCSMPGRADDAAVKSAIQAKYNAFGKAFIAKDADTISKLAAPGFTTKSEKGKVSDAKESLEGIKKQMKQVPPGATAVCTVDKVAMKGGKALVEATETINTKMMGGDNINHTISMRRTTQDTWVKVAGDWKVLQLVEKSQKILMDGKDLNPGTAKGPKPPAPVGKK